MVETHRPLGDTMLDLDERRTEIPAPTRGAWDCANCPTTNEAPRKRCSECGTSRH